MKRIDEENYFLVKKNRFPTIPLLVLIVGLVSIVGVFFFTFLPILSPVPTINSIEEAKAIAKNYIDEIDKNYKIEEIMEFSNNFYVIIQEQNTGINAFELLIDRNSGRIGPEPGPNMMWNTKYGHMGRTSNPTTSMPIDSQIAADYAQEWLTKNYPGAQIEELNVFYGYYTIDVSKEGRIFGMLSVNGYSGEVWYHSWHGEFISMEEYNERR